MLWVEVVQAYLENPFGMSQKSYLLFLLGTKQGPSGGNHEWSSSHRDKLFYLLAKHDDFKFAFKSRKFTS